MSNIRYAFGVNGLDDLLAGIEPGKVVLLEGKPGAGKTLMALSMADENARKSLRARTKYITIGEPLRKLLSQAKSIGRPIKNLIAEGLISIEPIPYLNDPEMVDKATLLINNSLNKYELVIVDSITPLVKLLMSYPSKRAWVKTVLYDFVSTRKSSLILVADKLSEEDEDLKLLEFIADVVLELTYKQEVPGAIERFINVKKFRNRDIPLATIPFEITSKGIILLNHLCNSDIERLMNGRKVVELSCSKLKEIIPSPIPKGTSVLLASYLSKPFVYTYFMWSLAQELINQLRVGKRVVVLTFEKCLVKVFNRLGNIGKESGGYIVAKFLNPLLIDPPKVVRIELETIRELNPDLLIVINMEKVIHSSSFNEAMLYKYGMFAINNLVEAGITTLRYIQLSPKEAIPKFYGDWLDIIIELIESSTGEVFIKPIKSLIPTKDIKILDDEFKDCIIDDWLKADTRKYFDYRNTLVGIYNK